MGAHTERLLDSDDGVDLKGLFWRILPVILGAAAALVFMAPLIYGTYIWAQDEGKYPEYSVTVASFSGLDPDRDLPRATLNPTFDLTVRIKETRRWSTECVYRGTVSSVYYRGVALAHGPVPEFCGRNEDGAEVRSVMAWGSAVAVPQFARDSLAEELQRGEAVVYVTLTALPRCKYCGRKVVECNAPVGRGEASPRCRVTMQ